LYTKTLNTLVVPRFFSLHHLLAHQEIAYTVYIPILVTQQNKALRGCVRNMYFGWNGHGLYDYLRDDKGLLYGMSTQYDAAGQYLRLDMNCEPQAVSQIRSAIGEYLEKETRKAHTTRFDSLQQSVLKNFLQNRDELNFESDYRINSMLDFGTELTSEQYVQSIQDLTATDAQEFLTRIYDSFTEKSIHVAISRNTEITGLVF
jgi:predicted Zn-dependent peptidase